MAEMSSSVPPGRVAAAAADNGMASRLLALYCRIIYRIFQCVNYNGSDEQNATLRVSNNRVIVNPWGKCVGCFKVV